MLDHHGVDPANELLDEVLTGEELRQLLSALGQREFGEGEGAQMRDVVEATSADPQAVARLLADIRKRTLKEKYGPMLEEHEGRIERLEVDREPAEICLGRRKQSDASQRTRKQRDVLSELRAADAVRKPRVAMAVIYIVLAIAKIVLLGLGIAAGISQQAKIGGG